MSNAQLKGVPDTVGRVRYKRACANRIHNSAALIKLPAVLIFDLTRLPFNHALLLWDWLAAYHLPGLAQSASHNTTNYDYARTRNLSQSQSRRSDLSEYEWRKKKKKGEEKKTDRLSEVGTLCYGITIWQAIPQSCPFSCKTLHSVQSKDKVLFVDVNRFREKTKNQKLHSPAGYSTCVKDIDFHRGGAEHCSSAAILPGHRAARFDESAWDACAASANPRLPRAAKLIGHSPWRFSVGEKICTGTNVQSDKCR